MEVVLIANAYSIGSNNIGFSFIDFTDKIAGQKQYAMYMLNRTQRMFKWNGLPDSIPQRNLELMIQTNGNVVIAKVDSELYAFTGGLGGEPNAYYMPTIYTIANPYLNFNANLKIDEECVVIPNDSLYIGLLPLFNRYSTMLAENDATIRIADINARMVNLISAGDDKTLASAKDYLKQIEKGKLGVIAENQFLEGVKTQPYATSGTTNNITQLIELQQYLKASWFNDIGLNANYNMKRESINSQEAQMGTDSLLPLVDDMLEMRKIACEKINAMFGTNWSVELTSSWEDRQEENNEQNEESSQETETQNDENEMENKDEEKKDTD